MSSTFHFELGRRRGLPILMLGGVIDEHHGLDAVRGRLPPGEVLLDLSGIERLSSVGVRAWVDWTQHVEECGTRFVLINCSPAFVMKLSRIHGLARLGRIYSILAPYRCPRCASDALVVLKTEELAGLSRPIAAPECRCKECEALMEFDETPESYFAFLNQKRNLATDPAAQSPPEEGAPSRKLRQRVSMDRNVEPYPVSSYLQWQLSPAQQAQIAEGKLQLQPDGAQRMVTVLVCSMRNFAALSEALAPMQFVQLLNDYFEKLEEILFRFDGTLDKLVGSELIGLFGSPVSRPDAARQAVACALDMQAAMLAWNRTLKEEQRMPVQVGIGVHTGPAFVGAIGSLRSRQHTAVGEAVKWACQLSTLAQANEVLASETTLEGLADAFDCIAISSAKHQTAGPPIGLCKVTKRAR